MSIWSSVVIAVVTAAATTLIAEVARAIWRYLDSRKRTAEWSVRGLTAVEGGLGWFFLIENTGDADALDVQVTVSGDAEYQVNAGVPLDALRPRDTFLMLVSQVGTGSLQVTWRDRKGKHHGPARRALTPPV